MAALFSANPCIAAEPPNILVAIADDQSFPHASAYGYKGVHTPAFDRIASMGVLFNNAFTPAPGCSPMRAAFLTGRNIWQIEAAGTHASSFSKKYKTYPKRMEESDYFVGYTGKGWGPGNWKTTGRDRNPAGPEFSNKTTQPPYSGINKNDYASNFSEFLKAKPNEKPFCFWFGSKEPHRGYEKGSGLKSGKNIGDIVVPEFLPDTPEIRNDIMDYLVEIEWFDQHLGRMIKELEQRDELENTLIIVTSDNGMPFPRAKANVYEYGIHMPLAISCPDIFSGKRKVDDLVSLIDVTATLYELSGVSPPSEMPITGNSLANLLKSGQSGWVEADRSAIYSGRERHSSSRFRSLSYPQRCIRTQQFLYIHNFRSERWPAGAPQKFGNGGYASTGEVLAKIKGPMHQGYHDIDNGPSLKFLVKNQPDPETNNYLQLAVAKRPTEELYDIKTDPGCLHNLVGRSDYYQVQTSLRRKLMSFLKNTKDPRVVDADGGEVWETYPRYSGLRWFPIPDWAEEHPERVPQQDWLEERRPR
jgi:uncharacterized sulfatase